MREKIAEVIDVNYNVSAWLDVDNSAEIADAILAALPECIKPLEWRRTVFGGGEMADCEVGRYRIERKRLWLPGETVSSVHADPKSVASSHRIAAIMSAFGVEVKA
jgi:hypothetical protein